MKLFSPNLASVEFVNKKLNKVQRTKMKTETEDKCLTTEMQNELNSNGNETLTQNTNAKNLVNNNHNNNKYIL